eukprot:TRINITY_DN14376_c0_g1_i1.p1 TRINITY_DN14376_c0_g1~~TRINITY_DN14376_c0_g1_i1.p1  ORF type:complete len:601 (+),score=190.40 TRINITY_DN14376_c0_g1_i1:95-1897(+)
MSEHLTAFLSSSTTTLPDPLTTEIENDGGAFLETNVAQLTDALTSGPDTAAAAGSVLASVFKNEAARDFAEHHQALQEAVLSGLQQAVDAKHSGSRVQMLRAIGNMCFEHPGNRQALKDRDGVAHLKAALEALNMDEDATTNNARLVSAGVIINAAGDEDNELKKELVAGGVVPSLVWLLSAAETETERYMAIQALARFQADESAMAQAAKPETVRVLIKTLYEMTSITAEDLEGDIQFLNVGHLLRAFGKQDSTLTAFAHLDILRQLLSIAQSCPTTVGELSALTLAVTMADDQCQQLMWQDSTREALLDQFVAWLKHKNNELKTAGAIAIGNVCRSDANAKLLGETDGLLIQLRDMLTSHLSFVQHAALSSLKNLTKLPSNREVLRDSEGMRCLYAVINDPQQPLQYLSCSVFRVLILDQSADAILGMLDAQPELLPRLEHLSKSEAPPVRCEAARALCGLIKASQHTAVMKRIAQVKGVDAIVRLMAEPHGMLQGESVMALVLLATNDDPECLEALLSSDLFAALTTLLEASTTPPPLACNVATLLGQLLKHANIDKHGNDRDKAKEMLTKLAAHDAAMVQGHVASVLADIEATVGR